MGDGDSRFYSGYGNGVPYYELNTWSNTNGSVSTNCGDICTVSLNYNNDKKYIFGSAILASNLGTLTINNAPSFAIFSNNARGNCDTFSSIKLYGIKFTDGSTLVNDLVPCYHKLNGNIGLCDIKT